MTWETFPCCCGNPCCPCNPLYGGNTSFRVTWNGLMYMQSNLDCDCVCLSAGPPDEFGVAFTDMYVGPRIEVTNESFVSTWLQVTDPLNQQFCEMSGYERLLPKDVIQRWYCWNFVPTCGPIGGRMEGGSNRVKIILSPRKRSGGPCPSQLPGAPTDTPWRVSVELRGIAGLVFDGGFDCIPGPFQLNLQRSSVGSLFGGIPLPAPSGTFACAGGRTVGWNAGTVKVT